MTSTETMASWPRLGETPMELLGHLFLVFPSSTWNSFGGVDAPPQKFGSRVAVSLYRWYRRASMHVPCGSGYSALWHVPAALLPCALCTLDELLDILAFSHGRFLNTNPIGVQLGFGFILVKLTDHIIVDTWRVVRSWGMPRPTSLLLSLVFPTCCCIQSSAIWSCQ